VVREGVGAGGRNDPRLVCTYELKKKKSYILAGAKAKETNIRGLGAITLAVTAVDSCCLEPRISLAVEC
jgi:hypothetical protein